MGEFRIATDVEAEIIEPTPYPLVAASDRYVYLILHFPTADLRGGARNQELDFIVGKEFMVTVRYEVISSLHSLHAVFEAERLVGNEAKTGPELLERVFRRMYGAMREEMETLATKLDRIERDIFSGKERRTVRTISETARVLLRFDTSLMRHEEPLANFLEFLSGPALFGKNFAKVARRIESEREHVETLVASYRAVASELRDTNDSLLSTSQNESMKTFTAITVVILPITLVADLFTIPALHVPFLTYEHGFLIIIAIMVVVEAALLLFLKLKKWL
jgi:magnesium transporter